MVTSLSAPTGTAFHRILAGQQVIIRTGLDRRLRVYGPNDSLLATHTLKKDGRNQWQLNPEHHRAIYDGIKVETRDLSRYGEMMS